MAGLLSKLLKKYYYFLNTILSVIKIFQSFCPMIVVDLEDLIVSGKIKYLPEVSLGLSCWGAFLESLLGSSIGLYRDRLIKIPVVPNNWLPLGVTYSLPLSKVLWTVHLPIKLPYFCLFLFD